MHQMPVPRTHLCITLINIVGRRRCRFFSWITQFFELQVQNNPGDPVAWQQSKYFDPTVLAANGYTAQTTTGGAFTSPHLLSISRPWYLHIAREPTRGIHLTLRFSIRS